MPRHLTDGIPCAWGVPCDATISAMEANGEPVRRLLGGNVTMSATTAPLPVLSPQPDDEGRQLGLAYVAAISDLADAIERFTDVIEAAREDGREYATAELRVADAQGDVRETGAVFAAAVRQMVTWQALREAEAPAEAGGPRRVRGQRRGRSLLVSVSSGRENTPGT